MILNDTELVGRCSHGSPLVNYPGTDGANNLHRAVRHVQPCSLEVTLSPEFIWTDLEGRGVPVGEAQYLDSVYLCPGEFALGSTRESVNVPNDLVGFVHGKSSWARKGLLVHVTAGLLDPGFRGNITLELKNVGHESLNLEAGMRIAQLTFQQLTSPAMHPYGSPGLDSHYQDQRGVTGSAL